jgi:hypothetical protein
MKNFHFAIALFLIMALVKFTQCSQENDQEVAPCNTLKLDTLTFHRSMKGWELYSWPDGNDWMYSILGGTNRTKTYEEVITNRIAVSGKDSLKLLLAKLPENENIFWIGEGC